MLLTLCVPPADVTPVFPHGVRHDQYTYGQPPWFQPRYKAASAIGTAKHSMRWPKKFVASREFSHGFVAANGNKLGTAPVVVPLPQGAEYRRLGGDRMTVKGTVSVSARNATVLLLVKNSTTVAVKWTPLRLKHDDSTGEEEEVWTLSTPLMNLSFVASGAVTGLVDRATGRNVLSVTSRSSLVTVRVPPRICPPGHMGACPPCICTPVSASAVTLQGNVLRATVPLRGSARLEVVMAVDQGIPVNSLVFSVMSLSCTNCTRTTNWGEMVGLNLLNLSVALSMCANTASASYDDNFGVSLVPADYYTSAAGVRPTSNTLPVDYTNVTTCNLQATSAPASARCLAGAGTHCGSATLWGGPRSGLLPSIEAAEIAFHLPSPRTADGTWLKTSAAASTGYIMASGINQDNFDQVVELAKSSGMKMVVLISAVANSGHFLVDQEAWNGTAGLAAAIGHAHAQGIKVGLHTMSASIPVQDSYITPLPDPRLAALTGWILQESINASTTDILLNKVVSPGWGLGSTLRIGDELITFSGSSAASNVSTLGGVVRGAYNTTAVQHWQGEQVMHMQELFGFLPDPATNLMEEMGANLAEVVDSTDCDYVYFDGIEGLQPFGIQTMSRMHRAFWDPVKRKDIIVQSSGNAGELWHLNTRSGQRDWGATDSRAFFSYFGAGDVAAASQDLQVPDLGWWPYNVFVGGSFYATTPDEVEFMSSQAAAWDGVQNLESDYGWLTANGRTGDALQRSSNWRNVDLPESVKEQIRASHLLDFQLFSNASGWFIKQQFFHPPFVCDTVSCSRSLSPAFAQSSIVGVRARALTSLAKDGSGQNLMLYGEGHSSPSSLGLVHSKLNASITFPPGGGSHLELNYSAAVATVEAMALFTEVFVQPMNLEGHTAIGLTIRGDGSNAILVIRLVRIIISFCKTFISYLTIYKRII
jgi:hypothetical protein